MFTTSPQISGSPIATDARVGRRRALRRLAVAALLAGNLATVAIGSATGGAGAGRQLEHVTGPALVAFTPVPIPLPTINPQPLPPGHLLPLPTINPQPLPPGA